MTCIKSSARTNINIHISQYTASQTKNVWKVSDNRLYGTRCDRCNIRFHFCHSIIMRPQSDRSLFRNTLNLLYANVCFSVCGMHAHRAHAFQNEKKKNWEHLHFEFEYNGKEYSYIIYTMFGVRNQTPTLFFSQSLYTLKWHRNTNIINISKYLYVCIRTHKLA